MPRPKTSPKAPLQLEVRRRSLDTQAAETLREAIVAGLLKPGERLTEEVIATSVQLSRGTIRASLRQLVHEGLVVQEPYKGYSVRSLTSRDAWEYYTLRNTLEAFAARLAAETINDAKRRVLDKAYEKVVRAVDQGSRSRAVEADFGLHKTILELTGHATLQAHYGLILGRLRLYQSLTSKYSSLEGYVTLHGPLIDAIREGRVEDAERLGAEHNTLDGQMLVASLLEGEEKAPEVAPHKSLAR